MLRNASNSLRSTLVVCAVALCALAPVLIGSPKDAAKVDLSLKDLSGKRVHLRDYQGKFVVLNFWATWCVPCRDEMPLIVEAEREYGPRGVVFVGASMDDNKAKGNITAFLEKHQVSFAIWVGATGDDLDRLGMGPALPATAFLDQEGHVVARILGQMRKGEIQERLDWLLAGRTGTAPQAVVTHLGEK